MLTFSEASKQSSKKFVGLFFTEQTQKDLLQWAQAAGFDLGYSYSREEQDPKKFDFHTTIYFTTTEHTTPVGDTIIEPFKLIPVEYTALGESSNIPAMKLDTNNDKLMQIRHFYTALGFEDAWPSYTPHISLSYVWSGVPDLQKLKLPPIEIWANRISVTNQS